MTAPQEYAVIPTWSEQATRCAVCLRLFPTTAQIDAHCDQECNPGPCWCEALCWVMEGGSCSPADGQDLDVDELFVALRACQERIAALTAPQERPVADDGPDRIEDLLTPEEQAQLRDDLRRIAALLAPCWRRGEA